MDILERTSAYFNELVMFWTFCAIGIGSGLVLFLSFIVGEVSDFFGDFFGGGDASADHDMDSGEFGHPSVFSFKILLTFFTGFGVFGAITTGLHHSILTSSVWGIGAGVVMGGIMYLFVQFLASQQGSVNINDADLIGKEGRVIVEIPTDGMGQVQVSTHAGTLTKLARAVDHISIQENSIITIERVVEQIALVKKSA